MEIKEFLMEYQRPHYGIDIANKKGTIVVSPSDGVVVLTEDDLYFSGGTIIISHGLGLTSSSYIYQKFLLRLVKKYI